MKISASVPDELWHDVVREGESTSKVVQEAFERLAEHRARHSERLAQANPAVLRRSKGALSKDQTNDILKRLDRQAEAADRIRSAGYTIGSDYAVDMDWLALERLPTGSALYSLLMRWVAEGCLEEHGLDDLPNLMREYEVCIDATDSPIPSPTFFQGVADGFDDVREAVRDRFVTDAGAHDVAED